MQKRAVSVQVFLVLCALVLSATVHAGTSRPSPQQNFSDAELDELLSPIALYPDPLLAQVVPAATFIDELEEAQRTLNGSSDDNRIANQNWDVAVKSVAHYPSILRMMVEKRDWTIAIGQAYANQSTDVGKSIQRLRAEAKAAGNLATTAQQQVIVEGDTIRIVPAQPQVIYVPQYNPEVVYVEQSRGPSTGAVIAAAAISFGAGLAIGAWLNNDWNWHGGGIFYHGWVGGGWIGMNRTFINVNRNIYINNNFRNINVNRNVVNRNINSYRTNLNRNATVRRNNVTRNNVNRNNVNRNKINNNSLDRNRAMNQSNDALRNRASDNSRLNDYRGHQTPAAPARSSNNSVFGGSGGREQIRQDHDRGNQSLNRMNTSRPAGATPRVNPGGGGRIRGRRG